MKNAKRLTRRQRDELTRLGWGSYINDLHFVKETKCEMHVYYKPLGKPFSVSRSQPVTKDMAEDVISALVD